MIDPDTTRQTFAGLIEKPALTDALLNRPPFKFLLDVITNTISSTGYLKNQFPKSDLDPNALADKGAKAAFLDKFISAVDDGSLSEVKSAKIIAGKEPEQTNKLLVKFAQNARNHMGEAPAVQKKERSSSRDRSKERSSKFKEKPSKDKDKDERSKSKDRESRHKEKEKDKEKEKSSKREGPKEKRSSSKSRDKEKSKEKDEKKEKKSKNKDKEKPKKHKRETEPGSSHADDHVDVNSNLMNTDQDEGFEETHLESPHQLPEKMSPGNDSGIVEMDMPLRPPIAQYERPTTAAARPQTSMGRPGTAAARPAPPKIKKKVIATIEDAQVPVESTVEIMSEEAPKDSEKEDLFIEQAIEEEPSFVPEEQTTQLEAEEGGLVQKMMETKAGLEEGQLLDDIDEDDTEFQREMNKLKDLQKTLQDITRTTFPLAHILEFAQEDLEAMIRELEKWRAETRQNEAEIKEKESMSIGEAQKLSGTLSNIEEEIRNVKTNLSNCKARIVANEDRIQLLMKDI